MADYQRRERTTTRVEFVVVAYERAVTAWRAVLPAARGASEEGSADA